MSSVLSALLEAKVMTGQRQSLQTTEEISLRMKRLKLTMRNKLLNVCAKLVRKNLECLPGDIFALIAKSIFVLLAQLWTKRSEFVRGAKNSSQNTNKNKCLFKSKLVFLMT